MYFTKSFNAVTPTLYLAYLIPLCMLCCVHRIECIITRHVVTKLCCAYNMAKINYGAGAVRLVSFEPTLATSLC